VVQQGLRIQLEEEELEDFLDPGEPFLGDLLPEKEKCEGMMSF